MIPAAFIIKDKDKIRLQTIDLTTMKRSILTTALVVLFASLAGSASAAAVPDQYHAMLSTYCFTCHSTRAKVGGLALESLDLGAAADDAKTWEKALRKLRGHLMPPPGNPQPPAKGCRFVRGLDGEHARCPP